MSIATRSARFFANTMYARELDNYVTTVSEWEIDRNYKEDDHSLRARFLEWLEKQE